MALGAGLGLERMMTRGRKLNPRTGQMEDPEMDTSNPMNAYRSAIPTQAKDYDEIMGGYRGMLSQGNPELDSLIGDYRSLMSKTGQMPSDVEYSDAPEMQEAFRKLKELSETGGLNEQEAGDLRARGISPIRAVYGNMQRGMDRQRALSGGYSPNYNASASRMAREQSESIAGATQNVNAEIAKMRQEGKLKAAPEYANLANSKNSLMNQIALQNQKMKGDWAGQQASLLQGIGGLINQKNDNSMNALRGMTSLYGTTPALVETFGNQVANQSQQNQNAVRNKQNYKMSGIGTAVRRM